MWLWDSDPGSSDETLDLGDRPCVVAADMNKAGGDGCGKGEGENGEGEENICCCCCPCCWPNIPVEFMVDDTGRPIDRSVVALPIPIPNPVPIP